MKTFNFPTDAIPASHTGIDPDFVHWWGNLMGLNTATQHTFSEAAKELYLRLFMDSETSEGLFNPDSDETIMVVNITH
jgi:hypothetical protein